MSSYTIIIILRDESFGLPYTYDVSGYKLMKSSCQIKLDFVQEKQ